MPLRDHFHPPLSVWRHWHSFHNGWAYNIASDLNSQLPDRWFAEPNVQFGIEIDVASFERNAGLEQTSAPSFPGFGYTPPLPNHSTPFEPMGETIEINIYNSEAGPILVGAIELVSPGNKDRASQREAFVTKCENYLLHGIGLVIVDIVTDRLANLHNELMARLGKNFSMETRFYAGAYRLVERENQSTLDIWTETLALGRALPVMPLWLRGETCLPVRLERAYETTCLAQKITSEKIPEPIQAAG